jgi:hypothetical protein
MPDAILDMPAEPAGPALLIDVNSMPLESLVETLASAPQSSLTRAVQRLLRTSSAPEVSSFESRI